MKFTITLTVSIVVFINKTLRLNNLKTKAVGTAKFSVFVIWVKAIIYLLLLPAEIVEYVHKYVDSVIKSLQIWALINQVLSWCFRYYGLWLNKSNNRVKQVDFSESTDINQLISMNWFYPIEALTFIREFFVFP